MSKLDLRVKDLLPSYIEEDFVLTDRVGSDINNKFTDTASTHFRKSYYFFFSFSIWKLYQLKLQTSK